MQGKCARSLQGGAVGPGVGRRECSRSLRRPTTPLVPFTDGISVLYVQSVAREATARKVCPDCAETVQGAAKVCRFCGYRFSTPPPEAEPAYRCNSCRKRYDAPDMRVLDGAPIPVCPLCGAPQFDVSAHREEPVAVVPKVKKPDPDGAERLIVNAWRLVLGSVLLPPLYFIAVGLALVALVRGRLLEPLLVIFGGFAVAAASAYLWSQVVA